MPPLASLLSLSAALLAVLGGAAPSGLLAPDAAARVLQMAVRRRDEDEDPRDLLLAAPRMKAHTLLAGHRSHSSHASHASHASHYSGSGSSYRGGSYRGGGGYVAPAPDPTYAAPAPAPPPPPRKPPPPKPALVSIVAYPGGRIFVDDKAVGTDATGQLRLKPGTHKVRVENKYVGTTTTDVEVVEGQTGPVVVEW